MSSCIRNLGANVWGLRCFTDKSINNHLSFLPFYFKLIFTKTLHLDNTFPSKQLCPCLYRIHFFSGKFSLPGPFFWIIKLPFTPQVDSPDLTWKNFKRVLFSLPDGHCASIPFTYLFKTQSGSQGNQNATTWNEIQSVRVSPSHPLPWIMASNSERFQWLSCRISGVGPVSSFPGYRYKCYR